MQGRRLATFSLVIWNILMVGWTATFLAGIGNCTDETGWQLAVCETGRAIGTEIGFPFILAVWVIGVAVLGLVWLRSRSTSES